MSLRAYKFVVQAVVQELDEAGDVIAEPVADPVTVFGCDALAAWASEFADKLADAAPPSA